MNTRLVVAVGLSAALLAALFVGGGMALVNAKEKGEREKAALQEQTELLKAAAAAPIDPRKALVEAMPTPEIAAQLTPEERIASLRLRCYTSGVCDEDALSTLKTASASEDEKAALQKVRDDNWQSVFDRVPPLFDAISRLEKIGRNTAPGGADCMEDSRAYWKAASAAQTELEGMAVPIPGAKSLQSAAALVRSCVALCNEKPDRIRWCDEARNDLKQAQASIRAKENL